MNEWTHTLSYLSRFLLVASSLEPALVDSPSVTGGTGHFSRNSLKIVKKNSFKAELPCCLASRKPAFCDSSHSFCSFEAQVWRPILPNAGRRSWEIWSVSVTWQQPQVTIYLFFLKSFIIICTARGFLFCTVTVFEVAPWKHYRPQSTGLLSPPVQAQLTLSIIPWTTMKSRGHLLLDLYPYLSIPTTLPIFKKPSDAIVNHPFDNPSLNFRRIPLSPMTVTSKESSL